MKIRKVTPADTQAILNIYAPYVINTAITFETEVPTIDEFTVRLDTIQKEYTYLVAEQAGEVVGYAYAVMFHGREAYRHSAETSLYVKQELRGQGIGRALYEALEQALLQQNVYTLYACITKAEADDPYLTNASIEFHEHLGYRLCGCHERCGYKFDRWYSIVWMEKVLRPREGKALLFIPADRLGEES